GGEDLVGPPDRFALLPRGEVAPVAVDLFPAVDEGRCVPGRDVLPPHPPADPVGAVVVNPAVAGFESHGRVSVYYRRANAPLPLPRRCRISGELVPKGRSFASSRRARNEPGRGSK